LHREADAEQGDSDSQQSDTISKGAQVVTVSERVQNLSSNAIAHCTIGVGQRVLFVQTAATPTAVTSALGNSISAAVAIIKHW
jgi:hypothetical protein